MDRCALVETIDEIINTLICDSELSLLRLGYLEETIDNEQVGKSAKGLSIERTVHLINMSVVDSVILSITRSMEKPTKLSPQPEKTLPNALELVKRFISEHHKEISSTYPGVHDDPEIHSHIQSLRLNNNVDRFWYLYEVVNGIATGSKFKSLKAHRDENVAHLLGANSRTRQRLGDSFTEMSIDDLKGLHSLVLHFLEELVFIWTRRSWQRNNLAVSARLECKRFWLMLAEVNDLKAIDLVTKPTGRIFRNF
jgi:hypothetical protein